MLEKILMLLLGLIYGVGFGASLGVALCIHQLEKYDKKLRETLTIDVNGVIKQMKEEE